MALQIIYNWNESRGFGRVMMAGQSMFVHVSAIQPHPPRGVDLSGEKIFVDETEIGPKGWVVVAARTKEKYLADQAEYERDARMQAHHFLRQKAEARQRVVDTDIPVDRLDRTWGYLSK